MRRTVFVILGLLLFLVETNAAIKVASILGDNMVLQRNSTVKLWGKATPGTKIKIQTSWNKTEYKSSVDENGAWLVNVKTGDAGGPYTIAISNVKEKLVLNNILLGEVWLCSGQSNMEMPVKGFRFQPVLNSSDIILNADNEQIRLVTLKKASTETPQDTCVGKWDVASSKSAGDFSAVGYIFAREIQKKLNIPVGVISTNWGGSRIEAWIDSAELSHYPAAVKRTTLKETAQHQKASRLYNGMIAPLLNCSFKGVLWYQGESNRNEYFDYADLMQALIKSWRTNFKNGDFPFYFAQIAPFAYDDKNAITSALLWEEQYKAYLNTPNTGVVCLLDAGDENCIHPAAKELAAKRFATYALGDTYHVDGVSYLSPVFDKMEVNDSLVYLYFKNAPNGLTTFGKSVNCVEIAGKDSVFYQAHLNVNIKAKKIEVYSDKVKYPVVVRYAFKNYPETEGYLYNTEGLPVLPFRTDK